MGLPFQYEYPRYFTRYTRLVPEGEILNILAGQQLDTLQFLNRLGEEVGAYRYEADKWSIKEVIGHIIDTERIFSYRALCIARDKTIPLPAFDQNVFAANANYNDRPWLQISDEFRLVRENTIVLFQSFSDAALKIQGFASDYKITIRAIPYIVAGHELHHRHVITEKYLKSSFT